MRTIYPALAIGLIVALAHLSASAQGATAGTDISAAKKKKKSQQYVRVAPSPRYVARPWMDPSIAPDGRPYRNPYPPGTCSVDEGYGRFSPCTFRD
jgi:hypothetical protein